ncbi:peptidoglycan/xylan/chitin deacetylase (PgdA/CDA1 family) [Rhodopseudomonas thermotolerans]|uniref:Chitooligosaccharide deacetylase n=3 Tax=Nitrobacteraceae TaxID=41294 RepID=A0A336JPQ5_9BRAD|nr:peptidoglycan/xylan/chitin deacetylase (PgdA/CDA1 family) [Rhodopseudomonas pentothenatexigens]REF93656.1 peptidoglycan/xylan/chitin deacetylase (PgdA/CDA1 family) [Rhodopseudomonas thermotolerans]SSW91542.1 peptidoglycan/xylan/chitin deacetylase (PgdA/CDA1 family) [Rhodopseudomonas pentothenatexigens]
MQYGETLPLRDREVVLTFDDGPLPRESNQVLDILAKECVKATFFVVGRMAKTFPEGVRKLRDAGHTIGTHSQNHPLSFNRMSVEQAQQEVDEGIASTLAALGGDRAALSPFFRIPGLLRAEAVEGYLASRGIQAWSADFPADDWRHVSPDTVFHLAMSRLAAKGKGILLLHDIQPRTVAALPRILQALKAGGYKIVHVVAATQDLPKTATTPQEWRLHPAPEAVASARWPRVPRFVFATAEMLPAPAIADIGLDRDRLIPGSVPIRSNRLARGQVPTPQSSPWPRHTLVESPANMIALPVPSQSLFALPERSAPVIRAMVPVKADRAASDAPQLVNDRNVSIDISAAARPIAGSVRIAPEGLQRGPLDAGSRPRPLNH